MAILKRVLLVLTLVNFHSCDLLLGSYFPIGMDMVTATADFSSTLSEFPINGTGYNMEEVDNHQGTKYLVMHLAGTGKSKTMALKTSDLSVVNSYPPDFPTISGPLFNSKIFWDSANIWVGTYSLSWDTFKTVNGSTLVDTSSNGKGFFNGDYGFILAWDQAGIPKLFKGLTGSAPIAYFNSTADLNSLTPIGLWVNKEYCFVSVFGSSMINEKKIYSFKLPIANIVSYPIYNVSIASSSTEFIGAINIGDKDIEMSKTFVTADGLIVKEERDDGVLVRYGFDGNKIDEIPFKFDDNFIHFSGDGKAWYRLDPYSKKLYRMRTWWSS